MPISHDNLLRVLLAERAKLHAYIWSIVRDEHMTEDIFQEVSLLAVNKRDEINNAEHLSVWLRQAARFESLKVLQKANRKPLGLDDELLEALEAEWRQYDEMASNDMIDALRYCLQKLTPRARRIVKLRYVDGLVGKRLAQLLDVKVHSVYVAVGRIHNTLRQCINRRVSGDVKS